MKAREVFHELLTAASALEAAGLFRDAFDAYVVAADAAEEAGLPPQLARHTRGSARKMLVALYALREYGDRFVRVIRPARRGGAKQGEARTFVIEYDPSPNDPFSGYRHVFVRVRPDGRVLPVLDRE